MNKTSAGRSSAVEINELSHKYKISQILKFTFQGLVPLCRSPGGAVRAQRVSWFDGEAARAESSQFPAQLSLCCRVQVLD